MEKQDERSMENHGTAVKPYSSSVMPTWNFGTSFFIRITEIPFQGTTATHPTLGKGISSSNLPWEEIF